MTLIGNDIASVQGGTLILHSSQCESSACTQIALTACASSKVTGCWTRSKEVGASKQLVYVRAEPSLGSQLNEALLSKGCRLAHRAQVLGSDRGVSARAACASPRATSC